MSATTVDIEGAKQYARQLNDGARVFRARHETGTWVGAVVIGALYGIAVVPILNLALAPAFIHDLFSRGTLGTPTYEKSPVNAYIAAALAFVVVRLAWRWFRQKPVEVSLDGEGITETEGGDVRLHIPWRDARAWTEERHYRNRYGQRFVRQDVRFAAPSGAMIVVSSADNSLLAPDHPMRTVVRDREIYTLLVLGRKLPPLDAKARDPRIVDERGALGGRIVTLVGSAIICVVGYAALNHFGFGGDQGPPYGVVRSFPIPDTLIMCAALFVGGSLRAIVPVRRFFRMRRLDRGASEAGAAAAGGAYRSPAKPASENEPITKHERLRAQVALGTRLTALVVLVLLPILARRSVNENCRRSSPYANADYCTR